MYLTESPDGYPLTPYDSDHDAFDTQVKASRDVMKCRRSALREIAE